MCFRRKKKEEKAVEVKKEEKVQAPAKSKEVKPTAKVEKQTKEKGEKTVKKEEKKVEKKPAAKPAVKPAAKEVKKAEPKKEAPAKKAAEAPARKAVYRVVYDKEDGLWKIKKDGAARVIDSRKTKEEALARVQELSENQDVKFVVHKKDGKMQKKANLNLKSSK